MEWRRRHEAVVSRLVDSFGYSQATACDLIAYGLHVIKRRPVIKTPRGEGVEWLWPLYPTSPVEEGRSA